MMDPSPKPPQALLQAISQDLRPVRPSPQPLRLTLRMVPLAILLSSLILATRGVRGDSKTLGPLLTWGASSGQFLLAIALVWIAAHESTPAGRLPRQIVFSAAAGAVLLVFMITTLTVSISPAGAAVRGLPWIADLACGLGSTIAGGILILLFSRMFRNSVATRPVMAGALYGAGAGIAINAGWRTACPVSTFRHALGAHGAAIIVTVLLGALIGRAIGSRSMLTNSRRA